MPTYQALLYYMFVTIDDVDAVVESQTAFCRDHGMLGRILVAPEGINGTVSGTTEACRAYMDLMHADQRFATMSFKVDEVPGHVFPRLSVRPKAELVTFREEGGSSPLARTGVHLSPAEFHQRMQDNDVIILDGRTDYEYDLGHFRKAIRPDIGSFREFPEWIRTHLADARHRPILTYCTGGIRCEKLTAFMLDEGFTDVYQLDGGIVSYGKDPSVQGALWDGLCYVFDERVAVPINATDDRQVIGRCYHCGTPTERYVNCANRDCHQQHLACAPCETRMRRSCSEACMTAPRHELPSTTEPELQP